MNSPFYGWALQLLPRVSMTDGLLDVAVFPRMGRWPLMASLFAVWRGRKLPARPVVYSGARITIASDEPVSVHADGVLAGSLPAEFVCRKGALSVFACVPVRAATSPARSVVQDAYERRITT